MRKHSILIVDDEPDMLSTCREALSGEDLSITLESDPRRALERLGKESFDLVVADIKMPGLAGTELLKASKEADPDLPIILMTAFPEVDSAVEALRTGASDYLIKPLNPEELRFKVARLLEERRIKGENRLLVSHLEKRHGSSDIIGQSPKIRAVLEMVNKVARTPADVMILGESGTGKELIARKIHAQSRRSGRFVPVDCGAIPENLLENEFFGHEKGAYTDASASTPGLLEFAHCGTFFLDEICELSPSMQAKLLRTLQERQFRRIGGKDSISVDVRVVAATNKDIAKEVQEGRFREELYYRLNVITLQIPSLRERAEDIPLLVEHYLPRFVREMGKRIRSVEDQALEILAHYPWPGNIRELQNVLKKAIVLCEKDILTADVLPGFLVTTPPTSDSSPEGFFRLRDRHLQTFEKDYFESLLRKTHGDARAAAQSAGLPLSSFYWHLKKHEIKSESFRT
ncbi:MAG: sigma-54-dependent Fis family transcriptional regulator [Elusimicrobia bacterium]|nr:sigma-54-dependent Fis family transcriptional regulator [Elusimicrobiota bacterium]